ncbi:hypothetical protein D7223_08735 [Micromonospora endolithica]|uniref:Uncharacterized protein n=1 Tax=Micromonospora endolithica TaxID=230091 RepID=A0A3A9ZN02_9ACTN|nr:hypothetical protein D7223_08735 [Micromonospora endolithica]
MALEGLIVLVLLAGLVVYVDARSGSGPDDAEGPGGVPARVNRPSAFPVVEGRDPTAAASPGLRPRQQAPSPPPAPPSPRPSPPAPPVLTVGRAEVPAEVDLTAVGSRDWVHWGLRGAGGEGVVRKRGGSGEIRDEGGAGERDVWTVSQELFRWRDGDPVNAADGTANGVYTCGAGNGVALAVASSGEVRTVHLYAGLWMARGRLDARLSTGGPTRTVRLEDPHTSRTADFTIRFQAPPGARLVLTWTAEEVFTEECGGVGLQAVALR